MYYDFKRKTFFASVIFASLAFFALLPYILLAFLFYSGVSLVALGIAYILLVLMNLFGVAYIVFEIISIILSIICKSGADTAVSAYCIVNIVIGSILVLAVLFSSLYLLI